MEPKGKTSFIPKKPVNEKQGRDKPAALSLIYIISLILFFLTLAGAGGVYFYKNHLQNQIDKKNKYLEESKEAFEISLLEKLQNLDKRLNAGDELLSGHLAPSVIFSVLEEHTLDTISFDNFEYDYDKKNNSYKLIMSGNAKDFNSVALQSDVFGELDFFRTPVFSNLGVNKEGKISFDFSSTLSGKFIKYKNALKRDDYKKKKDVQKESENRNKNATSTVTES